MCVCVCVGGREGACESEIEERREVVKKRGVKEIESERGFV